MMFEQARSYSRKNNVQTPCIGNGFEEERGKDQVIEQLQGLMASNYLGSVHKESIKKILLDIAQGKNGPLMDQKKKSPQSKLESQIDEIDLIH